MIGVIIVAVCAVGLILFGCAALAVASAGWEMEDDEWK